MKYYFTILFISFAFISCSQSPQQDENVQVGSPNNLSPNTGWTTKITKTDAEWKKILSPQQYYITRQEGTERPYSSKLNANKATGIYYCVSCQNPLFSSASKFESGTGWPSFYQPYSPKSVKEVNDRTMGMLRTEIICQRCDAHLGHVFNDGPKPTGLRYCMNGTALLFQKK